MIKELIYLHMERFFGNYLLGRFPTKGLIQLTFQQRLLKENHFR